MSTPFPGMDPYLERPDLWPNVHNSLIIAIRDELAPRLRPRYYIAVAERTVRPAPDELAFVARPDVAVVSTSVPAPEQATARESDRTGVVTVELPMPDDIREIWLEVRETATNRVITVLEILSPTNKLAGEGRRQYEYKRLSLLGTRTHLVEVDLLRAGEPMPMWGYTQPTDYRILVSRAERRPRADLFPFSVRQPIPVFRLPLQQADEEPEVELNRLLHELYDRAGYDLRIDYRGDPVPPLAEADASWADALLRAAGRR